MLEHVVPFCAFLPQPTPPDFFVLEVRLQRVVGVFRSHAMLEWYASTHLQTWKLKSVYPSDITIEKLVFWLLIEIFILKFCLPRQYGGHFLTAVSRVHFIVTKFSKVFSKYVKEKKVGLIRKRSKADYLIKLASLASELMQWRASGKECLKLFTIQPNCETLLPLSKQNKKPSTPAFYISIWHGQISTSSKSNLL